MVKYRKLHKITTKKYPKEAIIYPCTIGWSNQRPTGWTLSMAGPASPCTRLGRAVAVALDPRLSGCCFLWCLGSDIYMGYVFWTKPLWFHGDEQCLIKSKWWNDILYCVLLCVLLFDMFKYHMESTWIKHPLIFVRMCLIGRSWPTASQTWEPVFKLWKSGLGSSHWWGGEKRHLRIDY